MSQKFASSEVAMLIGLRQLLDDGRFEEVVQKSTELEADRHFSQGNAENVRLLSIKAMALLKLHRFEESLGVARDALSQVKGTSDNQLIAELQSTASSSLTKLGRTSEAEREYRDLIATCRRLDDALGVIRSLNRLSRIQFIKGQFSKAVDHLLEANDYAIAIGDARWQAMITGNLGTILNQSGEFNKALEYIDQSIDINRAQEDQLNLSRAFLSKAFALMHLHRFEQAETALNAAEQLFGSVEDATERITLLQYRAQLASLKGEYETAAEFAATAWQLLQADASQNIESAQVGRLLAEIHLGLGHEVEAGQIAAKALEAAQHTGERVEIAACRRILATLAARSGDTRLVDSEFAAVVRMLDEVGARWELAITYRAWSQAATKPTHVRDYRAEAERIERSLEIERNVGEANHSRIKGYPDNAILIGSDPGFMHVVHQVDAIADSELPVLLLGETGVGKDQIARYIHHHSSRRKGEFVEVNCGAIPLELAESQLFGHERGAFTSAVETKIGLLESATGGTLFLNEIGELPLRLQVKLLSAIEEKKFCRVGGTTPRRVDFRIIAATNIDLNSAVKDGRFRADLFFRIAVMTLQVPKLAERPEDAFRLFEHFMQMEQSPLRGVDNRTLETLKERMAAYSWPGNVRELWNLVRLFCIIEKRDARSVCLRLIAKLSPNGAESATSTRAETVPLSAAVEAFERSIISSALDTCGGIIRRAAVQLGLPEATLRSKMKKYRISAA